MMNSKHTPGPWTIDEMAAQEAMQEGIERGDWVAIESEEAGGHVAYCHPDNARLIAAAPELLNKLEELLGNLCDADREGDQQTIDELDALIQKAKGES